MTNKHPQRKRKGFKRPKTPSVKKERKEKPLKKPLRCGKKNRVVCEKHNLPCHIEVDWPKGDSRKGYKEGLIKLGAPEHTKESEHRCKKCFQERFENSPYQDLTVEGLDELTAARIHRDQANTVKTPN
jgi:hypothetical protein